MRLIIPAVKVLGHLYTAVPASLLFSQYCHDTSSRHPAHPHIFSTSCCCSSSSDLAPCLLLKKYRTLKATLYILSTITGIARGLMIYIYLGLCNSHMHRDRWIYITNNWSSLLLCCTFSVIPCTHRTSLNVICIFHAFIIKPLQCVLLLSLRLPHIWK